MPPGNLPNDALTVFEDCTTPDVRKQSESMQPPVSFPCSVFHRFQRVVKSVCNAGPSDPSAPTGVTAKRYVNSF